MGEIRLICPGCAAEYELDGALIPAHGRDVECSACGFVWRQPGAELPPARPHRDAISRVTSGYVPAGATTVPPLDENATSPRLNRPLPAEVLDILKAEAAHERAARAAEMAAGPHPDGPSAQAVPPPADWPATTVTATAAFAGAAPDRRGPDPASQPDAAPVPGGLSEPRAPTGSAAPHSATAAAAQAPVESAVPAAAPRPAPLPYSQARPAERSGRGLGFLMGLALCVLVLALYLATAPEPGAVPGALRAALDQARLWLAEVTGRV